MTDRYRHADARVWGSSIGAMRIDRESTLALYDAGRSITLPLADARGLALLRRLREQLSEREAK